MKLNSLFLTATILISAGVHADVRVVDDSANELVLKAPAKRIISLAPHTTELLYAAGAIDELIAAVDFSDYPAIAKKLPRVGSGYLLDIEKIISLEPDLVVGWKSGNQQAQLEYLQQLGLSVYLSEPRNIQDVADNLRDMGMLLGKSAQANKKADEFVYALTRLRKQYAEAEKVTVFYQVWQQPLFTVNGEHIISHIIDLCGGVNVFADLPVLSPQVDIEAVISRNPQVIVAGSGEAREDWLDNWKKWSSISAVKHQQLYAINADLIVRHTTRIAQGAEIMCAALQKAREAK